MLVFKNILPVGVSVIAFWYLSSHSIISNQATLEFFNKWRLDSLAKADSTFLDSVLAKQTIIRLDSPYKPTRFPYHRPQDRYADPFSSRYRSSKVYEFPRIKTDVVLDPDTNTNRYEINEKLNKIDYRAPSLLTEREMRELQEETNRKEIMQELSGGGNAETATSGRRLVPHVEVEAPWFDRIFGGNQIEFRPVGFVNLDFGMQYQRVANQSLPIRQQRNLNFNFDPHANLNLTGKVGNKLQISGSFDTKSSFEFENNFKLEYRGYEEDIIRKIEFGNVSFPLSTTLIQGGQNLFGLSTELQFGRLKVRSVYSNQRARAEQINLRGGAQRRNFEVAAGEYEDNRHFFLSQFFRDNYENWLRNLPAVTSGMQITRIEVYVTNRVNNTQDLRNLVAFLDLGESNPFRTSLDNDGTNVRRPADNNGNSLFNDIRTIDLNADTYGRELETRGFRNGTDYTVLRAARKLNPREYTYNPQLGYISLLTPLRNDEVLAVAYEYTYNGRTFKVGELTDDYASRNISDLLRLKMIRPPQIRLDLPTWDLMMKNVYSLNASQINRQNFLLRIIYKDDLTGIDNPTLQEGVRLKDRPLLRVVGLDKLNPQNDPQPDGNFDFIEGITIDSRNGRLYFPVLEPFGSNLIGNGNFNAQPNQLKFDPLNETGLINKYVFDQLYRSTKADALQNADKNKFFIQGSFEATAGSDVTLPGINIPEGSVRVTAGGVPLVEGVDYTVDYSTGKVQILDESLANSGKEVKVEYEKADLFNFQQRRFWGTRFDYAVNPSLNLGATVMSLSERPILTRVNVQDEPVNNTLAGFDVNFQSKSRFLTRLVDMLPGVQTKQESNINFYGEVAKLFPKASQRSGAVSFIDDFEGTRTSFNFVRAPQINWRLGATPQFIADANSIDLNNGFRRAKIAWYNVDNIFYNPVNNNRPRGVDLDNHYSRAISPQEVFPNRQRFPVQANEIIFDVAYYPEERGPYNYTPNLTSAGLLPEPRQNFGAITRAITSDIDFDNANVEYLEFWLLDPFLPGPNGRVLDGRLNKNNTTGGDLYINLGNISEDVIPDTRHAFENGLPADGDVNSVTQNKWGRVTNQQYITNAFDNSDNARTNQDVGFDGLRSIDERNYPEFQTFVNYVQNSVSEPARSQILQDLSADNFSYFLGSEKDADNQSIVQRYKNFNGMEGNSPVVGTSGGFTASATNLPDNEDLNIDNTINNLEGYYQYKIPLLPNQLRVGQGYVIDKLDTLWELDSKKKERVTWYLIRIPIRQFEQKIGNIEGFKSIRFMRMFLTNFQEPVVLRFAQMQLVASQWRRYLGDLSDRTFGLPIEPYDAKFNVSVVNIEENGSFAPGEIPYTLPPGSIRDLDPSNPQVNRQINEQSMRLCVDNLRDKDARAVFRNYNMDFLSYKRVRMFIHAEDLTNRTRDGEVAAFIRLGTDFTDNYYEIEVPLKLTIPRNSLPSQLDVWPSENEIDVPFAELTQVKVNRNRAGQSLVVPYSEVIEVNGRRYRVTVNGNPDLSAMLVSMIGIRNPDVAFYGQSDDKLPKSVCVWVNEFRITEFDQTSGMAALARANIQLADFAQITASASYSTFGFGSINQRISERTRETTLNYSVGATIAIDKFLPEKWGFKIPLAVNYERKNVSPRFNPLDPDVQLNRSLEGIPDEQERSEYERLVEENFTQKGINLTNVRKVKTNPQAKAHLWDFENFSFTWAYTEERRSDINTADYLNVHQLYGIAYNFTMESKFIEPFKSLKFLDNPFFKFIKDFNFSLLPNSLAVRGDVDRRFTRTLFRAADRTTLGVEPLFQRSFLFNRTYALLWNFSKSLNFNYNAATNAVVDEPFGNHDTQQKRDSVWNNLRKLGRMKGFNQQFNFTYRLPLDKLPGFDWMNADANFTAGMNWLAGAIDFDNDPTTKSQAELFGNVLSNSRDRTFRGGFEFSKLYQKSKFLADAEKLVPQPKKDKSKEAKDKNKKKEEELKPKVDTLNPNQKRDLTWLKRLVKPILMLKRVNFTYTINEQTIFPGFTPTPRYLGLTDLSASAAPGIPFILGSQNGEELKRKAIANNWLATSPELSNPFTQNFRENLSVQATLEPVNDFRIQVDFNRTRQTGYLEFFRFDENNEIASQNPVRNGNYTISFLSFKTAFRRDNFDIVSENFRRFANNRDILINRLEALNGNDGEYGRTSQDVLIPSFLAAYSGKSAEKINLSAFPKIPLPNWQVDYNGLTKIPFFQNYFSSFTLRHSYNSKYSVGNFNSSLLYDARVISLNQSELDYAIPFVKNEQGEYVPIFVVAQVLISEKFSPLVGLNFRTKSNLTIRLDYNKERDVGLNLANSQISEVLNKSILVSVGFTKANMKLPFKQNGKKVILKNDVDFRLDFTLRDSKTIQRQIEQDNVITGGNLNAQVRPVISYVVSQQLTLQFYMEQNINAPRITSNFARRTTSGGIQLRYNITQ